MIYTVLMENGDPKAFLVLGDRLDGVGGTEIRDRRNETAIKVHVRGRKYHLAVLLAEF